ncbi:uncharacterized protein LOC116181289 [Photinus pyralis]|uniref:uncharacterized protein LOC116181289 n=1 Tax=Photinus pyralis TaxID=7054 RepID=UPI0012677907|nr:uncharacterized protein LOC116181289 [Photinus pyralis]
MPVLEAQNRSDRHTPPSLSTTTSQTNLREERKRTGRYVAAGTAIFLSIVGVYETLIRGAPEYAAIFLPAVIIIVYVLWILNNSKNQNSKRLTKNKQGTSQDLVEVSTSTEKLLPIKADSAKHSRGKAERMQTDRKVAKGKSFNRSFSIA